MEEPTSRTISPKIGTSVALSSFGEAGKCVFSKNDGQESTVAVCLSFKWFYPVAKYPKATLPRDVQY
jgi:hypothetical protein